MRMSMVNLTSLQTSMVLFYWRRQKDVERYELEQRALQICEVPNLKGRTYRVICAKSIIYHKLYNSGYNISAIAKMMGVTHSTVINLLKKYDDRLLYDKEFKMLVDKFNNYGNQNES